MGIKEIIANGQGAIGGILETIKKIIPEGALQQQLLEEINMAPTTVGFMESCKNIELDTKDGASEDQFRDRWHAVFAYVVIGAVGLYGIVLPVLYFIVALFKDKVVPVYDSGTLLGLVAMLLGYGGFQLGAKALNNVIGNK